jgi:3-hydroxyacyl-CoA dehydrogenase/enoyl-CoA hydratase/3-hydroxybutyryl-CoA epimerase
MSDSASQSDGTRCRHWHLRSTESGVAILTLDQEGTSSNVLSRDVLDELGSRLDEISRDERLRGLVVASGKASGFVFGADIREFDEIDSAEQGTRLAAEGQAIIGRIAALRIPSVAAIDGFALGGGLELALACDYRIAVESWDRRIGLPEVQLGIQPGFGGVVRTVRLLGPVQAMDLALSGRLLSAVEAHRAGLVDRLATREALLEGAVEMVLERPAQHRPGLLARIMNLSLVRPHVAKRIRAQIARRANPEHYPAPYAILDQWVRYGGRGEAAFRAEAESIGRLFMTPTCTNLLRVYKLRERLKNLAPKPREMERVHVVGAGVMGGDIASWCALRGLKTTLQDQVAEAIDEARERAAALFQKRLKAPGEADAATQRLQADASGSGLQGADIVIEAIVERLDIKQQVFAQFEERVSADTVLATNTSSLRIEDIAAKLTHPQRVVGVHFFNPVAKMPLVEVIHSSATDPDFVERAVGFVIRIGKLPLPCRSAPGFLVNRVLTPYLFEALRAHIDGHTKEEIDAAAVAFGMPVGPIELSDQVGLDVALHVAGIMRQTLGTEPPALLEEMVSEGKLGVKSGQGFYRYEQGKAVRERWTGKIDANLQDRLILPLVNECVACLHEGIVEDRDLVDAGVIFGTGFAPFRGGPLQYAQTRGAKDIVETLEALAVRHGPHFAPKSGWKALAMAKKS